MLRALATTEDGDVRAGFLVVNDATAGEKLGLDQSEDDLERAVLTLGDAE